MKPSGAERNGTERGRVSVPREEDQTIRDGDGNKKREREDTRARTRGTKDEKRGTGAKRKKGEGKETGGGEEKKTKEEEWPSPSRLVLQARSHQTNQTTRIHRARLAIPPVPTHRTPLPGLTHIPPKGQYTSSRTHRRVSGHRIMYTGHRKVNKHTAPSGPIGTTRQDKKE